MSATFAALTTPVESNQIDRRHAPGIQQADPQTQLRRPMVGPLHAPADFAHLAPLHDHARLSLLAHGQAHQAAAVIEVFDPLFADVRARTNQVVAAHFFTRRQHRGDEGRAASDCGRSP